MSTKLKLKLNKNIKSTKQDKNRNVLSEKLIVDKFYYKRNNFNSKKKIKPKVTGISLAENKKKHKCKPINIEDSSTNYFSGNNKKVNSHDFDFKMSNKKLEEIIIPVLISKESEHESLFINYKLGEKDSMTESTVRSDLIICNKDNKIKNLKQNKKINNYNRCEVEENLEQNENNSFEIYDFSDKTNVDFVLRNLSALSCSKSGKERSSFLLNDCNDEFDENIGNKQKINKIKIFNAKQSIPTNCSKNINQLRLSSKY
jgi:hypothetical protein